MSAVEPGNCAPSLPWLVHRFQADVWRYLHFLGADASEAEDLVQETFLALIRSSFRYQSDEQALAYLRTTARRQLLMARRSRGREVNTVELEAAELVWAQMQDQGGWDDYVHALEECLRQMNGRARSALDLYYHQGLNQHEVGTRLGLAREGVKTLLRRARDQLRQCVERKVRK